MFIPLHPIYNQPKFCLWILSFIQVIDISRKLDLFIVLEIHTNKSSSLWFTFLQKTKIMWQHSTKGWKMKGKPKHFVQNCVTSLYVDLASCRTWPSHYETIFMKVMQLQFQVVSNSENTTLRFKHLRISTLICALKCVSNVQIVWYPFQNTILNFQYNALWSVNTLSLMCDAYSHYLLKD